MSFFFDPNQRTPKELLPGVTARTFWGERLLISQVDLAPGAVIPTHSHPHEQITTLISGSLEMTIAGETHRCQAGDICVIPGGTGHSVVNGPELTRVIDAFSPVRDDYKFPD